MKTENKIAVACFIGGFIGTILALIIHQSIWWVGMLLGGAAGYLSYEWREVCRAWRIVWESICRIPEARADLTAAYRKWLCRFLKQAAKTVWEVFGAIAVICLFLAVVLVDAASMATWIVGSSAGISSAGIDFAIGEPLLGTYLFWVGGTCLAIILSAVLHITAEPAYKGEGSALLPLFFSPGVFPFTLLVCIVAIIAIVIAAGAMLLWHFVPKVLTLIYSEERLLCGVYGAVGVWAGRMVGQHVAIGIPEVLAAAIFGGIVGAFLGKLNYKLVSVRFKLVNA